MFQLWQLQKYQPAATQMCSLKGEMPYEPMYVEGGDAPRWALYAQQMADFELMLQVMRACGVSSL